MAESGQDFAARYWGGEGVVPIPSERTFGYRDVDGGRPTYPAGWKFSGDGFHYRVWFDTREGKWEMSAQDGAYATFWLDGKDWVIESYGSTRFAAAR